MVARRQHQRGAVGDGALGELDRLGLADAPVLHDAARRQPGGGGLVPGHHTTAPGRDHRGSTAHEREEVVVGGAHRFVAADVDQLAGHRSRSVVHVSEQFVGGLPVGAHRHLADAGVVVQRRGDAVTAQLRVGAQRGRRVPRGVELGDDLDEPVGGVADDPGVVRRRVEAAGTALDVVRRAHLGEQRPRRHHQPPPLVVAQVEVEVVDLVQRHQVDVAEHRLDREEVPGDVEHRAAVGEAGPVGDVHPGHGPRPGKPARGLGGRRRASGAGWSRPRKTPSAVDAASTIRRASTCRV